MNSRECRVTRREIDEAELHQKLSRAALAHLASCPPCSEFRDQRASLRELVGNLGPVTAPPDFDMRLRARIAAQRQSPARGFFFRGFAVTTPAIAVAALVVMALVVWFVQHSRNQNPTLATAKSAPAQDVVNHSGDQASAGAPDNKGLETAGTVSAKSPRPLPNKDVPRRDPGAQPSQAVIPKGPAIKSMDLALQGAQSIRKADRNSGEVSLSAPLRPMVVSMEDDSGMTRKFLLPPVSFGSQRLVDNRIPAKATNTRSW